MVESIMNSNLSSRCKHYFYLNVPFCGIFSPVAVLRLNCFQCMNNLADQQIKAWMVPSSYSTSWHAFVTLLWHKIFDSCFYLIPIGCELSKDKREYIWTAPEESEDDIEHKLQISQVRLIHDVQSFLVSIMPQEHPTVFSLYSHKINFVVVHAKSRLTDTACACVMK